MLDKFKDRIRWQLQPWLKLARIKRYCRMGLNDLDSKLEQYIDFKNGVFLEVGANDGINQSNTYYLQAIKGWTGILIEPVPWLYESCKRSRKGATCVHAAVVSSTYTDPTIFLEYADLMTMVSSRSHNPHYDESEVSRGRELCNVKRGGQIEVPARTLDSIIKESPYTQIDFLSLDVEGYEVEALKGLNLERNGPSWILVEVRSEKSILPLLQPHYIEVERFNRKSICTDILFSKRP